MTQIAVGHFDVHEVEAQFLSEDRGGGEVLHHIGDLAVLDDVGLSGVKLFIQQGVGVGGNGFQLRVVVGMAVPPGVGQLEPDEGVGGRAEALRVGGADLVQQGAQSLRGTFGQHQLAGVAPARLHDGAGLAPEEELGPGNAEVPPAPPGELAGRSVMFAVPSFHGQDAPAVADDAAVHRDLLRHGGRRSAFDGFIGFQRLPEGAQMLPELGRGLER